eukprot:COSAG01_NODE_3761_length_5722_cov_2.962298_5_plen_125_part_00
MVISVTASVLTHRHRASQATGQLSSLEGIRPSITRWHRPAIATAVRRLSPCVRARVFSNTFSVLKIAGKCQSAHDGCTRHHRAHLVDRAACGDVVGLQPALQGLHRIYPRPLRLNISWQETDDT